MIDPIINTVSINIFSPWWSCWRQRHIPSCVFEPCKKFAIFHSPYRGDAHKGVANRNSCPKLAHPSHWPCLTCSFLLRKMKKKKKKKQPTSAQLLNELSKDINLNFGKSENFWSTRLPASSSVCSKLCTVSNLTTLKNNIHQLLSRSSKQ